MTSKRHLITVGHRLTSPAEFGSSPSKMDFTPFHSFHSNSIITIIMIIMIIIIIFIALQYV